MNSCIFTQETKSAHPNTQLEEFLVYKKSKSKVYRQEKSHPKKKL